MKLMCKVTSLGLIFAAATAWAQAPNPNPALSSTPAGRALQERRTTNAPVSSAGETLTPEMKEKLRAAQEKFRDEQKAIQERLTAARAELNAAIQAENLDESTIRQKAAALGQVEADQAVLRARQYHEMRAFLPKKTTNAAASSPIPANRKATTKTPGSSTNKASIKSKS